MLSKDFREFIELLNKNDVDYLVVGGYAVGFHGYPRYTKDIDIWIESSAENASKLLTALEEFGFGSLDLSIEDFTTPDRIVQLGYPPNRIDLLTSLKGVRFADCRKTAETIEFDNTKIRFIDLESLKANKRAVARAQDLADLENLQHLER